MRTEKRSERMELRTDLSAVFGRAYELRPELRLVSGTIGGGGVREPLDAFPRSISMILGGPSGQVGFSVVTSLSSSSSSFIVLRDWVSYRVLSEDADRDSCFSTSR